MKPLRPFKDEKERRRNVGFCLLFLITSLLLFAAVAPFFLVAERLAASLIAVASCAILVLMTEVSFRALHAIVLKRPYQRKQKIPFDEIYWTSRLTFDVLTSLRDGSVISY